MRGKKDKRFQGSKAAARRASIQRKGERMVKMTIQRAAA